jgi:crotonobetainyl-CoA:carnitine CoA-transferase CaiB-like acyl-CoA transferase
VSDAAGPVGETVTSARLIDGVQVVDMAGEAGQMAGRVLADLGAEVVKVEPASGDPLRRSPPFDSATGRSLRLWAWSVGKQWAPTDLDGHDLADLLATADLVLASEPRRHGAAPTRGSWVTITPYGSTGPRSTWRGSDLTCTAASGYLSATGDPDRPPLRCSEPLAYAQAGGEIAFAALTALASGRPQHVDVSIQEAMLAANMSAHVSLFQHGDRGSRAGGSVGRTPEVWRCRDGFVVFGMRGGPSRAHTWEVVVGELTREGIDPAAFEGIEWSGFEHDKASDAELREMGVALAAYFAGHTLAELYELGVARKVLIAPVLSAAELLAHPQLRSVSFFRSVPPYHDVPFSFARAHHHGDAGEEGAEGLIGPRHGAGTLAPGPAAAADPALGRPSARRLARRSARPRARPWEGVHLLEFGTGIAAPMTTRYFVEYGATCVHVESATRPDAIRLYSTHPLDPTLAPLEGSVLFANVNAGKQSLSLDMRRPEARELALRLVDWADAVVENYAPSTLPRWGLGPEELGRRKPGLVMLRSSMWGSRGPHADYPGYGAQGTALSGYLYLTGWPDRGPAFPFGTVTDSVSPRYSAAALAAALLYRDRTGRGVVIDVSQIEAALFTLSPWLLDQAVNGHVRQRAGNRSDRGAVPHGVFPTRAADRWIALAVWSDADWDLLCEVVGITERPFQTAAERLAAVDAVEELVGRWTGRLDGDELAGRLQAHGVEAFAVRDFADVLSDPQLRARRHFVELAHPVIGRHLYERSGFRLDADLDADPGSIASPGPTLGQHTEAVLRDILGLDESEIRRLAAGGVLR